MVNTLGKTPGKDMVPYEGPSFPDDAVINMFLFDAIFINSIILLSL